MAFFVRTFVTGDNDEGRNFNVTLKTAEQNLIVRIDRSEAAVINNKRKDCDQGMYCTVAVIYWHEAFRASRLYR